MLNQIKFCLFIIFSFLFAHQGSAKSIVVLLDNSASMKLQEGDAFSQCDASIFSIQLILSTKSENDNIYVIPAYRNNENVQILKNPSIEEVKQLTCYNASIYKSLKEAIHQAEIIDENDKKLILVGDGEWFTDGDTLTNDIKNSLMKELLTTLETTDVWYLNTSKENNPKNQFKNVISEINNSRSNVNVVETDNNPEKLLSSFDLVTKNMLKIPDSKQDYKIKNNQIIFNTKIPIQELFVLVQSFKNPYQGKLSTISSSSENSLSVNKNFTIQKGDIFGGVYSVNKENGLIKPAEISFQFSESIPPNAKVSIYYIPGITLKKPTYAGNPEAILSSNANNYRVCDTLSYFSLKYNLKDIHNKNLTLDGVQVEILDSHGNKLQQLQNSNSTYKAKIPLNSSLKEEEFIFSIKIQNAFEDKVPLRVTKSKCIDMGIQSKSFDYTHNLAIDSLFAKRIELPKIFDNDTKTPIQEEQAYLEYKILGDTINYNVLIEDSIEIIQYKEKSNFICDCLKMPEQKTIKIEISHPNVKDKAYYTINIEQVNAPIYIRCWKPLLILVLIIAFLVYLILLRRKKKFYRKAKMRAKIVKYDNNRAPRDQYLRGSLLNRLNPFIPETATIYGLRFKATSNKKILVSVSSIERKARDSKILVINQNNLGFEFRKKENKKYEQLSEGKGIEFRKGRNSEKYMYQISRKK